jgi:hypothetical protein
VSEPLDRVSASGQRASPGRDVPSASSPPGVVVTVPPPSVDVFASSPPGVDVTVAPTGVNVAVVPSAMALRSQ